MNVENERIIHAVRPSVWGSRSSEETSQIFEEFNKIFEEPCKIVDEPANISDEPQKTLEWLFIMFFTRPFSMFPHEFNLTGSTVRFSVFFICSLIKMFSDKVRGLWFFTLSDIAVFRLIFHNNNKYENNKHFYSSET